jgi:hypothetical protein
MTGYKITQMRALKDNKIMQKSLEKLKCGRHVIFSVAISAISRPYT